MRGRYELKFLITAEQRARFLKLARHSIQPDPNGDHGTYRVSSQYFDTPHLTAYWEKIDGQEVRKKFRLRYYSEEAPEGLQIKAAFMEIKHRINHTVFKERVRLQCEGAQKILAAPERLARLPDYILPEEREKRTTITRIRRFALLPGSSAVNVVTYLREAWVGEVDRRLRVTFDTACRALRPGAYLDVTGGGGRPLLPPGVLVMEIKFDHSVPRWIRDIVAREGAVLRRFSKYATAVEVNGLVQGRGRVGLALGPAR